MVNTSGVSSATAIVAPTGGTPTAWAETDLLISSVSAIGAVESARRGLQKLGK